MKKLIIIMIVLFAVSTAFAQITGSAHDFSNKIWNNGGGSSAEICITCHTPHNADVSVTDSPLWNHEVTVATFTIYSSATMDATTTGQPNGASKLCLSCHDGTVAKDNFGGRTTGDRFITKGSGALVGTDLSNDHPVSFTYDDALATTDGGLHAPTSTNSGLGGTIQNDFLISNKLECASCHDVHDAARIDNLLVKSNAGSALCLTCHNK